MLSYSASQLFNLATIVKASEAIQSEINLENLPRTVLHIILENAGAQKGCLILEKHGQFFVEATSNDKNTDQIRLKSILIKEYSDIPQQIINRVIETQDNLIIPDAINSIYNQDTYIKQNKCKSIICLRVVFQNQFIGILYLENNLTTNAFSSEILELIKILVSQAAIAINNGRLFASEREKSRILQFRSEIDSTLAKSSDLQKMLQRCTEIIVSRLDAAFARIWTHNSQEKVLELQASAGMYTHINGAYASVPVGKFKIGLIAQERQPHITNSVQTDPRVSNKEWAIREGMVAFAGYPLIADSEVMGVVALFSKQPLNQTSLDLLSVIAGEIAIAIKRKSTEEILQQKEQQYHSIFETVNDGLAIIDLETRKFVAVNPTWCQIYGYSSEEFMILDAPDYVHANSLDLFNEYIETVDAGKEFYCQGVCIHKSGTLFDVEVKATPYIYNGKPHALTIIRDISDRKQAEVILSQKEQQYRSIFETVSDGLAVMDLETGKAVAVNPTVCQMYGYSSEEFLNLSGLDFMHQDSLDTFAEFIETVKAGKEFCAQAVSIHKNGTLFDIEVKATPYIYDGKPHALTIARDISDRKQAEEVLKQRTQELEKTLVKLQSTQSQLIQTEKISQLGQLVAGVAHEVNNPVGFISGNLCHAQEYTEDLVNLLNLYQQEFPNPGDAIEEEIEAIELEYLLEDLPQMITSMKLGTDRIKDIMLSLRNYSRTSSDEKKAVNLHEGIDTTLMILSHRLKAKSERPEIKIVKNYADLPLVECYHGQINQVFMNLISNAIDALDESNQGKSYEQVNQNPNVITIITKAENNSVTIIIADNGVGIPLQAQQKLFDAFFTTKVEGKGTGLGLSISYQIVTEKHSGTLECISSPGNGAKFVIRIPR